MRHVNSVERRWQHRPGKIRLECWSLGNLTLSPAQGNRHRALILAAFFRAPVRCEFLDQGPFWESMNLKNILQSFKEYYNRDSTHQGISVQIPEVLSFPDDLHLPICATADRYADFGILEMFEQTITRCRSASTPF